MSREEEWLLLHALGVVDGLLDHRVIGVADERLGLQLAIDHH